MPRSILTEKLSRRGYHLSREYGVDPLETITVSEVMTATQYDSDGAAGQPVSSVFAYSDETCRAVADEMATTGLLSLPVVDRESGNRIGFIGAAELLAGRKRAVQRESDRSIAFQFESQ
jgi:hypothetical protein